MKKYLSLFFTILLFSSLSAQDCSDLFFSEYVEGPANNNGLEIYNPTSNTFDLSA
jgi:predicted extracellular nuclease